MSLTNNKDTHELDGIARREQSAVDKIKRNKQLVRDEMKKPGVKQGVMDFIFGKNEDNPLEGIREK